MKNLFCTDTKITENMDEDEIEKAEEAVGLHKRLVEVLSNSQTDFIKIGIELSQIDSNAKDLIATIGVKNWKKERGKLIKKFKKELTEAEEMIKKSKEKLEKKQNDIFLRRAGIIDTIPQKWGIV